MTSLDWAIVFLLNGSVIVYGFFVARGTRSCEDWFLGSRSLAWWTIALSSFATGVDNAEIVSATANTFQKGNNIVSVYTVGLGVGALFAGFVVLPRIYRAGLYTNAEFLEQRYSCATRVCSALIQIQYRSTVLGLMIWSIYLVLTQLVQLSSFAAWSVVVSCVVFSGVYTAWGGLKAVVMTDVVQGLIVIAGVLVIAGALWNQVGGWGSLQAQLTALSPPGENWGSYAHVGQYRGDSGNYSPLLIVVAWTIISSSYWTVNHTQAMRYLGARSVWDMQMAIVLGCVLMMPVMLVVSTLGLYGRVLFPNYVGGADAIYPLLANTYLAPGFKGVVVAGVVAAAISSFDSIGSALSAVFTRDVYARLIVRDGTDDHYVRVSRWATLGILALGFAYLPFIMSRKTMLDAFTSLVSVFVTPLFTLYVLGCLTRVARRSGVVGLTVGAIYGVTAFLMREFGEAASDFEWFCGSWSAYLWSMALTTSAAVGTTLIMGRIPELQKGDHSGGCDRDGVSPRGLVWLVYSPLFHASWFMVLCCYVLFVWLW